MVSDGRRLLRAAVYPNEESRSHYTESRTTVPRRCRESAHVSITSSNTVWRGGYSSLDHFCHETGQEVLSFCFSLQTKIFSTFKALLPRILIDTQPLLQYDSSDALISVIVSNGGKSKSDFDVGQEAVERYTLFLLVNWYSRENIVSTTFVLIGCDINGSMRLQKYLETMREPDRPLMTPEKLINSKIRPHCSNHFTACVRLLQAECETVGRVVLQKLHSLLDGNPVKEELSSAVVSFLFCKMTRTYRFLPCSKRWEDVPTLRHELLP